MPFDENLQRRIDERLDARPEGFERREELDIWIEWGLQHARSQLARAQEKKS